MWPVSVDYSSLPKLLLYISHLKCVCSCFCWYCKPGGGKVVVLVKLDIHFYSRYLKFSDPLRASKNRSSQFSLSFEQNPRIKRSWKPFTVIFGWQDPRILGSGMWTKISPFYVTLADEGTNSILTDYSYLKKWRGRSNLQFAIYTNSARPEIFAHCSGEKQNNKYISIPCLPACHLPFCGIFGGEV